MTTAHNSELELNLEKIEKLGFLKEDENFKFRSYLKGQNTKKIDKIVQRLNSEISNRIDCTTCGNCCMKLKPCINEEDILRLSHRLNRTPQQIKNDYIEREEGEHSFKNFPCSFLKEKKCTIYEDRPEDCRSFPHLHKKRFISRLWGVIENYSICPIVFNVLEKLKTELNYK